MNQQINQDIVFSTINDKIIYNRGKSMSSIKLESELANCYECVHCRITNSGLSAISILMNALYIKHVNDNINIIYANELYPLTPAVLSAPTKYGNKNVNVDEFDVTNASELINLFTQKYFNGINILFAESASNPHSYMFDFEIIPLLRKLSKILYVIIDNTWLTELILNPFDYDVDFVILSLTKYYSAGNAIGGAILADYNIEHVDIWMELTGQHTSPVNCEIIYDNIASMAQRIERCSDLTTRIIDWIQINTTVKTIHPYNKNNSLWDKYAESFYPCVIVLVVDETVIQKFKNQTSIDIKVSFGSKMSRINPLSILETQKDGFYHIRLAIGYDDTYQRITNILGSILC
uniref:Aminotransferase class V domain-containing protein n=1 Tax=viral metagenome TaxID=1070528 RepID=A0A6C0C9P5_9ZZZZ